MKFKEKKDILTNYCGIKESDLEKFVQKIKRDEASEINDQGIDVQLTYLFQNGWSIEKIIGECQTRNRKD